ncbi:MAG: hypothetical protein ACJAXQ_000150 [Parvibaculaceae bacterium]|jgi:hypothetical protein
MPRANFTQSHRTEYRYANIEDAWKKEGIATALLTELNALLPSDTK